jgi:hypothetical protein
MVISVDAVPDFMGVERVLYALAGLRIQKGIFKVSIRWKLQSGKPYIRRPT